MRNLRNTKRTALHFVEDHPPLTATAWDPTDDSLILAFGPTVRDPRILLKRLLYDAWSPDQAKLIASWDASPPNPDLDVDQILDLHYFPDSKKFCLVLLGGDIVVVHEEAQSGEDAVEIVGSVDAGITAASWSPDEDLLAISTKADTFLYMTRDFEGLDPISLSAEDLKVSEHVSVGWGKKETQFQGRGAKALRDPTIPEHVDEGVLSRFDDGRSSISWRGDAQFVALNSILHIGEQKRRIIRVFSREGEIDSVSEPVDGMESALSWKPTGQNIASTQRHHDKIDVIFFERNGLRHGGFSLRLSEDDMDFNGPNISLKWNVDSTVLAVSLRDRVQLWTMGNYHYYLKQEVLTKAANTNLVNVSWHQEKALCISTFAERSVDVLSYISDVTRRCVIPPRDDGLVAVIDGTTLNVTPFRKANVPPPMALYNIELPNSAIDVAFSCHSGQPTCYVLHETGFTRLSGAAFQECSTQNFEMDSADCLPRQIAVDSDNHPVVLFALPSEAGSHIHRFSPRPQRWIIERPVQHLVQSVNPGVTLHFDDSGKLAIADENSYDLRLPPHRYSRVEFWEGKGGQRLAFGLAGSTLHIVGSCQLRLIGVTSFVSSPLHLAYTTAQHLLKFIHLGNGTSLEVPLDEPDKDERCRAIERGARIVTMMPSSYSLVLQMPRGNLETIYPRALVLGGIRQDISHGDYWSAFSTCRKQRVDLNILHDYAPDQFLRDVDIVVKQLKKVEHIDLVLSSLSPEDVSKTIYKETLQEPQINGGTSDASMTVGSYNPVHADGTSKVNRICDAFLGALYRQQEKFLQSIVTAHVCKSPPDLEAALQLVSRLRKDENNDQLEQAVEHICFLADVNELYDTALGLYDLEVTLLVAQQSQKDPREYLPYLQGLHDMADLRQKFVIDDDLKRHNKALGHLHAMGAFEEFQAYTVKHDLYSTAIEMYRYEKAKLFQLMRMFADHLSSRNRYREAGIAYEYVGDHASAHEAYKSANMWRECLASAALVPISGSEMEALARDLVETLEEGKDMTAAAIVHLEYLHSIEAALRAYCKGYQFGEAIRLAAARGHPELIQQVIDPGLIEASATMTEILAEMKSQLGAQVPRVRELRLKKAQDPMAFLDGGVGGAGGAGGDDEIPDNLSVAATDVSTSAGTFLTRYTNRSTGTLATNATRKTSKNRRREERKRARGKKGTVYEEEYLVNSIGRLIERVNSIGEDVSGLVQGLMRRSMRERALAVETAMGDVEEACRACVEQVFQNSSSSSSSSQEHAEQRGAGDEALPYTNGEEMGKPVGGEAVLWEALHSSKKEAPKLKAFERLSLLAQT